jgi:hypothetical protein
MEFSRMHRSQNMRPPPVVPLQLVKKLVIMMIFKNNIKLLVSSKEVTILHPFWIPVSGEVAFTFHLCDVEAYLIRIYV